MGKANYDRLGDFNDVFTAFNRMVVEDGEPEPPPSAAKHKSSHSDLPHSTIRVISARLAAAGGEFTIGEQGELARLFNFVFFLCVCV